MHVRFIALSVLLVVAAGSVFGQPPPPPPPPGRVLLFPEPSFRGAPLEVAAGESLTNLHSHRQQNGRRWNDSISSLKIEGPVRLVVFGDANFKGERLELRRSQADLTDQPHGESGLESWDDRISSLKVEWIGAAPEGPQPHFRNQREADRAIRAAFQDILGREPDHVGLQNYRRRLLDQGWSEARLRSALRDSNEFRTRDFDPIVRKIFQEVLGRDPDPSGLSTYRARLREGWSENDLRSELKRSDEAKDRVAKQIVVRAYRELLGREPDDSGLATYTGLIRQKGWSEQRVRDTLKASEEYRNRPKP